jgi:hypothetical protein
MPSNTRQAFEIPKVTTRNTEIVGTMAGKLDIKNISRQFKEWQIKPMEIPEVDEFAHLPLIDEDDDRGTVVQQDLRIIGEDKHGEGI